MKWLFECHLVIFGKLFMTQRHIVLFGCWTSYVDGVNPVVIVVKYSGRPGRRASKSCCILLYLKKKKILELLPGQLNSCMTVRLQPFSDLHLQFGDIVKCLIGGVFYPHYSQFTGSPRVSSQQNNVSRKVTCCPWKIESVWAFSVINELVL